jgi:phosphoserine phosphatase
MPALELLSFGENLSSQVATFDGAPMFTATFITHPDYGLDDCLVKDFARQYRGAAPIWLGPDAAQVGLPDWTGNAAQNSAMSRDQARLQDQGVDLVVQPGHARRRPVVLADMDSTMIEQECIDELADHAGIGEKVKEITALAMDGKLDFEQALEARVALLKGQPATMIDTVLQNRISLMPGAAVLLATMKANGAYAALVSGGFTAFTAAIAQQLGFDEHRANRLVAKDGVLTGTVTKPILGRAAKVEALQQITAKMGLAHDDVLAVGDGANDLGMLGAAGLGVAVHAKPSVQAQARYCINHGDLTALLYLQGYHHNEFVTP